MYLDLVQQREKGDCAFIFGVCRLESLKRLCGGTDTLWGRRSVEGEIVNMYIMRLMYRVSESTLLCHDNKCLTDYRLLYVDGSVK